MDTNTNPGMDPQTKKIQSPANQGIEDPYQTINVTNRENRRLMKEAEEKDLKIKSLEEENKKLHFDLGVRKIELQDVKQELELERLTAFKQSAYNSQDDYNRRIENVNKRLSEESKKNTELESKVNNLENAKTDLERNNLKLNEEIGIMNIKLSNQKKEIKELEAKNNGLTMMKKKMETEIESLQKLVLKSSENETTLKKNLEDNRKIISDLNRTLKEKDNLEKENQTKLKELREQNEALKKKLGNTERQIINSQDGKVISKDNLNGTPQESEPRSRGKEAEKDLQAKLPASKPTEPTEPTKPLQKESLNTVEAENPSPDDRLFKKEAEEVQDPNIKKLLGGVEGLTDDLNINFTNYSPFKWIFLSMLRSQRCLKMMTSTLCKSFMTIIALMYYYFSSFSVIFFISQLRFNSMLPVWLLFMAFAAQEALIGGVVVAGLVYSLKLEPIIETKTAALKATIK